MSYADTVFNSICTEILKNGTTTKRQNVRPVWPDTGEPAHTIKIFGVSNKYDLRKEFPAVTSRRTALKSAFDEILWIYQKKSNDIHDLNSHIWDEWADENGKIGKAYGYQVGSTRVDHRLKPGEVVDTAYPSMTIQDKLVIMDQMDGLLYGLKNDPFSRRHKISLWNVNELTEMNLQPCCYDLTFNVTDENEDKLVLNLALNQRSQDMLAANNWNTAQYALLLMAVAQVSGMTAGVLQHNITDAHIYDRHVEIIEDLISRKTYPAPKVWLDPSITNFYDFTPDHLHVEDYQHGPQVKNIPIAV